VGYGLGIVLVMLGLFLAVALKADTPGLDLQTVGWILVLGGLAITALTAVQANQRRQSRVVEKTTEPDGSQVVTEHIESDPPPSHEA
jgi:hypothetical protein